MITPETIVFICWILILLYWIINYRNAKPSLHNRNIGKIRFIYIALVIILLSNYFVFHKHVNIFPVIPTTSPAAGILGTILTIIGLVVAVVARHTLGDNWSPVPDLKKGHTLVTSGIYSYIQHPIYTAMICMVLGALFVYPVSPVAIVLIIVTIVCLKWIKKEEALMLKTFPRDYPAYKSRTKSLIPFIY
jgi:protein-S-isoprenylcysteine O-methyltransferase Ste14